MINFTEIFIRRPVLSMVVSLFILLAGIASYFSLTLREFPKVDSNVVGVWVDYSGASPDIIESSIVTPIENSLGSIDGIDYIYSESNQGFGIIRVIFKLGYNFNTAVSDVTSKVQSVRYQLPKDVKDPNIFKFDPNTKPMMFVAFESDKMSSEELTDYLTRVVQPQFQIVDGVGTARLDGGKEYAMRVWLNPYEMAAHNITAHDVYQAITSQELQVPTGDIKNLWQQFSINAITGLTTADQFSNLVVKNDQGQLTKLMDVGRVELGVKDSDFSFLINSKPGVAIQIVSKGDANPLDVSSKIKQALKSLQPYFPAGLTSQIALDASEFIKSSIHEIQKTLILAAIFVIAIVFIFLGSLRVLLIPVVTIPLSIIGVLSVMLVLGYSLNILTLLALVLAVGMVVDDAIVVVENIYRHITAGKTPVEAAVIGAKEIQFAIISITLTLAAVYAPIGFTSGLTKVLFKEFAFTLAGTVIISGLIALTLSPMMCSRIMTPHVLHGRFAMVSHRVISRLMNIYKSILTKVLKVRFFVLGFLIAALAGCYFLYNFLPHDLAPQEDVGYIQTEFNAPAAANIEFTQKYADKMNGIYQAIPEVTNYAVAVGSEGSANNGHAIAVLKPWGERKLSTFQIIKTLREKYAEIPGLQFSPSNPRFLPGSSSTPVMLAIQSTGSFEELNNTVQKLLAAIKTNPNLADIDTSFKIDQPQLDVVIDRNKAGALGISMQDITESLSLAFSQPEVAKFSVSGRDYDVIPELDAPYKDRFDAINNLQLRANNGSLVPLSNLVSIKESVRPRSLSHFQQMRFAPLESTLPKDYTIGEALKFIQDKAKQILPSTMKLDYMGQSRQFMETSGSMLNTFGLAMIFIFLILAAQFESFRAPLIVMISVPLSILGALATLVIFKGTLNIYSQIGLITLVGLISKHGILMVEFANQLRKQGSSRHDAIIEAANIRLRPILMTTCAMIFGALPLALATGASAASRQQIGLVIVGGMTIGTLFTLFVVPVVYVLIAKK